MERALDTLSDSGEPSRTADAAVPLIPVIGSADRAATPSLVVEFLGLPASGKTTLALYLREWLIRQGVDVRSVVASDTPGGARKLREYGTAVAYLARRDPASLRALVALGGSCGYRVGTWSRLGLNWCSLSARHRRLQETGGIKLVDQGVYQLMWSLAFACGPAVVPRALVGIGASLPVPDAVVLVKASPERVLERLVMRPGKDALKRGLAAGNGYDEVVARGNAALSAVARIAARDMRERLFEIDNDGRSPGETAAALGRSLQGLLPVPMSA